MKGHFAVNGDGGVAYIDDFQLTKIVSFLYVPSMRMITIIAEGGSEHTLDSEVLEPALHDALSSRTEVLVVRLDASFQLKQEYIVPIIRN